MPLLTSYKPPTRASILNWSPTLAHVLILLVKYFFAKQAAEGRKSRAATFEAEVACEAVFGSFARESLYCDDFDNFENFLPP